MHVTHFSNIYIFFIPQSGWKVMKEGGKKKKKKDAKNWTATDEVKALMFLII